MSVTSLWTALGRAGAAAASASRDVRRPCGPNVGRRTANGQAAARSLAAAAVLAAAVAGCSDAGLPSEAALEVPASHLNHSSAAHTEKGYIDGWLNGENVSLFYTKWYSCEAPPTSGSPTGCVLGADAESPPRLGPIPTIYAIAAAGFQPDPATLACRAGTPCLNHPAMLDASRVVGPGATNVPGVPHSHIIADLRGGWWNTVNIRVFSPAVWNEIAAAKSLAKVRELQADPAVGGAGLISQDTPTNIFFFISAQPEKPNE